MHELKKKRAETKQKKNQWMINIKAYVKKQTSSNAVSTDCLMSRFVHGWKARILSSGLLIQEKENNL